MLINLTPHSILIAHQDGTLIREIAPSGVIPRVETVETPDGEIDGIPVTRVSYGEVDGLPATAAGVYLLVSGLVRAACPDRDDLVSPGGLVRDERGRVVGCTHLAR